MLAEVIVLTSFCDLFAQILIFLTVPAIAELCGMEICKVCHFEIIAAADSHLAVRHDPHICKRHQAGLFDDLVCCLLIRCTSRTVCKDFLQITHLNVNVHALKLMLMSDDIIIDLLHILMQLHVFAVIVDDQLIDIGLYLFDLINIQQQSVGGHEDIAVRQLFSGIFMKFYDTGIQPGLIIAVQGQMSLVAPFCELIDNGIEQILIHSHIWTLLCVLIGCAEGTGRITTVDGLDVDHIRIGNLFGIQEIIDISLLRLSSCHEL